MRDRKRGDLMQNERSSIGIPVRVVRPWHRRHRFIRPIPLSFPVRGYNVFREFPLPLAYPLPHFPMTTPSRWPASDLTDGQQVRLQAFLTRSGVPWNMTKEDDEYFFVVPFEYAETLYRAVRKIKREFPDK